MVNNIHIVDLLERMTNQTCFSFFLSPSAQNYSHMFCILLYPPTRIFVTSQLAHLYEVCFGVELRDLARAQSQRLQSGKSIQLQTTHLTFSLGPEISAV